MASRLSRSNLVTVNDVLAGHVKLDLQCLDRIYLNGYVPNLLNVFKSRGAIPEHVQTTPH